MNLEKQIDLAVKSVAKGEAIIAARNATHEAAKRAENLANMKAQIAEAFKYKTDALGWDNEASVKMADRLIEAVLVEIENNMGAMIGHDLPAALKRETAVDFLARNPSMLAQGISGLAMKADAAIQKRQADIQKAMGAASAAQDRTFIEHVEARTASDALDTLERKYPSKKSGKK